MLLAWLADADKILLAEFLKFKEGRNSEEKKNLQRESSTFQSSGIYLFNSCKNVSYRELMVRTISMGLFNCLPLKFTGGQQFSSIKQWLK